MTTSCAYVREYYKVPAEIGRRVIAYGKPGIILEDRGHYIGVALDDDKKVRVGNYHPTDGIVYGDMADKLPKRPRRSNYDKFEQEDLGCSFEEWLSINKPVYQERACTDRMGVEYRMVRYPRSYSCWRHRHGPDTDYGQYCEVKGEWLPSKPEAKISYKAALYKYLAQERANSKVDIY